MSAATRDAGSCELLAPSTADLSADAADLPSRHTKATVREGLKHLHPALFSPVEAMPSDGYIDTFLANQNPANDKACAKRSYLLIENDLYRAGLGMVGRLLVSVFLLALRQGRILLEIPLSNRTDAPWCDRPPFTFGCVFRPWTRCQLSAAEVRSAHHISSDRIWPIGKWSSRRRIVVVSTSWVWKSQGLLHQMPMTTGMTSPFVGVFVRQSPEKDAELIRVALRRTPPAAVYQQLIRAVTSRFRLSKAPIFLSTSNPSAVESFVAFAANASRQLVMTHNERDEHDSWGGHARAAKRTQQALVAAVNLYVASKAAVFLSLSDSSWTQLQLALMAADGGDASAIDAISWAEVTCGQAGQYLAVRVAVRRRAERDERAVLAAVASDLGCTIAASKHEPCSATLTTDCVSVHWVSANR